MKTTITEQDIPPLNDWHPLDEFVSQHPNLFTLATLRWQLRHRDTNGLAGCCVRVGKKLLISKSRYEGWLASQGRAA